MHGVIQPKPDTRTKLPLSFQRTTVRSEQSPDRRGLIFLGGIAVAATALLVLGDVNARREERAVSPETIASEPARVPTNVADEGVGAPSHGVWDSVSPTLEISGTEPSVADQAPATDSADDATGEPLVAEATDPIAVDEPIPAVVAEVPAKEAPATIPQNPDPYGYDVVAEPPGPYIVPPVISPPYIPTPRIQRPNPVPAPSIQRPATMQQPRVPSANQPPPPAVIPVHPQPPNIIRP